MHISSNKPSKESKQEILERMNLQRLETGKPSMECIVIVKGVVRIFTSKSGNVYTEIVSDRARFALSWVFDKIPPGIKNGTYAVIYGNLETGNLGQVCYIRNAFTFRQPRGIIKNVLTNFFRKYSLLPALYKEIDQGNPNKIFLQWDRTIKNGRSKGI